VTRLRPGLRGTLLLSVLAGIALVLAALTLAFNLVLNARLSSDASGLLQARISAELASLHLSHRQISLPEAPDEANPDIQVWVFAGNRALEQPRISPALQGAAASLARLAPRREDLSTTRLQSVAIVQSGRRLGAVVAAVSLIPYQQTRRTALIASGVLALVVLLVVAISARWIISRALIPVARMTRQASDWSEHDVDRRFSLGAPHDELTLLAATLDGLLERLAASLRHEQRLTAELSHELRTPLTAIRGYASSLLQPDVTWDAESQQRFLARIAAESSRLGRLVDDLLDFSAIESGILRLQSDWCDIPLVIDAAVAVLPPQGAPLIEVYCEAGLPVVWADHDRLEQVFVNLLANAVGHNPPGTRVMVTASLDGVDTVLVSVADNGPGMPPDVAQAPFEPMRRHRSPSSGSGLGLSIARGIVEAHGGQMQLVQPGRGTCFRITLPVENPENPAADAHAPGGGATGVAGASGPAPARGAS